MPELPFDPPKEGPRRGPAAVAASDSERPATPFDSAQGRRYGYRDIIAMYPIEQGAAELVGYLALADDDIEVEMDDSDETLLEINDLEDPEHARRIRLAKVTVKRT